MFGDGSVVGSNEDCIRLQQDIDHMKSWEEMNSGKSDRGRKDIHCK